jgi:uncharacterized membrane protein
MNGNLGLALLISVPILLLLVLSFVRFQRVPTMSNAFPALGAACLSVMVLTHIAEALRLFPAMGFGQRHSLGHYLDLASTYLGIAFLVAASLCPLLKLDSVLRVTGGSTRF